MLSFTSYWIATIMQLSSHDRLKYTPNTPKFDPITLDRCAICPIFPKAPQLGMEFMGFLRVAVQKHAFGAMQSKAYIHGARLLRSRLAASQSEDCLYLNVRTTSPRVIQRGFEKPSGEHDRKDQPGIAEQAHHSSSVGLDATTKKSQEAALMPVMVYFHGGDHHDGAGGSRPFYAANALPVKGRVVLVTFNYRLGIIGHFTHPELAKEAEAEGRPAISGNYSVLDQVR